MIEQRYIIFTSIKWVSYILDEVVQVVSHILPVQCSSHVSGS